MVLYDSAQHHQSLFNRHFPRSGKIGSPTPGGHAEYYLDRSAWETDRDKKIEFLEKSERAGREALKVAEDSDVPNNIGRMHHILSRTLTDSSKIGTRCRCQEKFIGGGFDTQRKKHRNNGKDYFILLESRGLLQSTRTYKVRTRIHSTRSG